MADHTPFSRLSAPSLASLASYHAPMERFRGADLSRVADRARRMLGDDVMILHTRTVRDEGVPMVEVLAAPSATIDRCAPGSNRCRCRRNCASRRSSVLHRTRGPTGAGKTTTAAKLAVRRGMFGAARPGLLTIDTYRVGGMEQLATYAELADVPFEVVYDAKEVDAAMKRLSQTCDVVLVDTPGRSPASAELTERWRSLLDTIAPDEVHLVLPASLRADLAVDIGRAYRGTRAHCGATHVLLSKLDEVPRETGVTDLGLSLDMPARWVTDGQDVRADLEPGMPRLLRTLGLGADAEPDWTPA